MIESIGSTTQAYSLQYSGPKPETASLMNFSVEDKAIISAQAKILNELEKFNAGEGNEVDLALAATMGRLQTEASVNVIKTKDEMMEAVLDIIE